VLGPISLNTGKPLAIMNLQTMLLGCRAVAFSVIVGTTVFATLEKQLDLGIQLAVGAISVLSAIL